MKSWPHFSARELASPDTGEHRMNEQFMERLEAMRVELGFQLLVTSAYRSPEHNAKVGGKPGSAHQIGRAVDISIGYERAFRLVAAAIAHGFTGIGVSQKGRSRFIHLDDMEGDNRPRIWSY